MRANTLRKRLWLGVGAAGAAAIAATGALGVTGGGTITTIAGTGVAGFSGDGGPATAAKLTNPVGMAVDGQGNVYIADHGDGRVRKVTRGGTISTFAGTGGGTGFSGEGDGGPATSAVVGTPLGVAGDGRETLHLRSVRQPCAQGQPRRDDHDVRRNGRLRQRSLGGRRAAASAQRLAMLRN